MGREIKFKTVKAEGKTHFIGEYIVIVVDHFLLENDKHYITDPQAANAHFLCMGKQYIVGNTDAIATVEDWYMEELLPKYQMLNLLMTPTDK